MNKKRSQLISSLLIHKTTSFSDPIASSLHFDPTMHRSLAVAPLSKLIKCRDERKKGTEVEIRILQYCFSFAENQFGDRTIGKSYRERNGAMVDNWHVEFDQLYKYCYGLGYANFAFANSIARNHIHKDTLIKAIYYFEESLSILEPWRLQFNSEKSDRYKVKISDMYENLSHTAKRLADCHMTLTLKKL